MQGGAVFWHHGKNTQFRVSRQFVEMKAIRQICAAFLLVTLSICFFSSKRGQRSNLDKLDEIAKVNTARGLVMFLSLSFSFPSVSCSDSILFSRSLTGVFCDGATVRQNDSVRLSGGGGGATASPSRRANSNCSCSF